MRQRLPALCDVFRVQRGCVRCVVLCHVLIVQVPHLPRCLLDEQQVLALCVL